jgi:hypothetical protein
MNRVVAMAGTEYVRADLLPAGDRANVRALLRNYRNRRFQDVLINAVDYAAGRDFCSAT